MAISYRTRRSKFYILHFTLLAFYILHFTFYILPAVARVPTAQDAAGLLGQSATRAGFPAGLNPPEVVIGTIVQGFIALVGVIFGLFIIYGGYLWMTARGNEEQVKKSQGILRDSIIGFIIVVGAYALSSYVVGRYAGLVLR